MERRIAHCRLFIANCKTNACRAMHHQFAICNVQFAICNLLLASFLIHLSASPASAQSAAPAPPTDVVADDAPDDVGKAIDVRWTLSVDDVPGVRPLPVLKYEVYRQGPGESEFQLIGEETYQSAGYRDTTVVRNQPYEYRVVAVAPDGTQSAVASASAPATAKMNLFMTRRAWLAVIVLIVCGAVGFFIVWAWSGRELYIRPIPGLEAVDEAVGRATEMGRSCLFVPGIQDINDIQTVAGITVLGRVAKLTAEYGANLDVPTSRSLVMTAARETVQAAYLSAGRPDAFNEDQIYYLTDEQFGYVAGVTGKMVRDKPAACFYMGSFFAESLLFAETGNAIGAIQVAGTAQPSQLPFFVAACDYTLLGEEFFAASAYLSGEPIQLGSLRGQDIGKILGAGLLIIGCLAATIAVTTDSAAATAVVDYLKNHVLGT